MVDEYIERPCAGRVNKRPRPIKDERRERQSVNNVAAKKGARDDGDGNQRKSVRYLGRQIIIKVTGLGRAIAAMEMENAKKNTTAMVWCSI